MYRYQIICINKIHHTVIHTVILCIIMQYHLYITAATASSSFFTCTFCAAKIGIPFLPTAPNLRKKSWASGLLQEDIVVSGPFQLPRSQCCRLFLDTLWSLQLQESNHDHTISTHFLLDTACWNDKFCQTKFLWATFKDAFSIFQSPTFAA